MTPFLLPVGQPNTIAVQVRNEGYNSRWYSGSGIYRHVWLTTVNPTHIATWGTFITTPFVDANTAKVSVKTTVSNAPDIKPLELLIELYSPFGKLAGTSQQTLSGTVYSVKTVSQVVSVLKPQLWSLEKPSMYTAKIKLLQNGNIVDETTTPFGIRTIKFDSKTGFTLNGKMIKLHGGCIHHDNGPLGAAAIDRAEERKIELLKQQGYNAIRLSHNPPSPKLLDACDRMGMLVIDEAFDMWEVMKTPQDYHLNFKEWSQRDLQSMILRDRNHPGIIMWSIGNEIPEVVDSTGHALTKRLTATIHSLDATRPVTMAITLFAPLGKKNKSWKDTAPAFASLDVGGYNYASSKYESDHETYPDRVMFASEYFPTKGVDNWLKVETLRYVIGTFSWTAMDYLGEAGLGAPRLVRNDGKASPGSPLAIPGSGMFLSPSWPIFGSYTGELDLIGNKKVNSYYLDVVWKRSAVQMLVHNPIPDGFNEVNFFYNFPDQLKSWSFPGNEGKKMQVFVYSRAQSVTLELNGRLIGDKTMQADKITASFDVPYEPGTLIAKSFTNGKQTGSDTLSTTGKPFALRLRADRKTIKASRNDLSYVSVEVVDAKGHIIPYAELLVRYQVRGNGEIAGLGNGNPADMSSFQLPEKKVYHGRGLVIIRPKGSGNIVLAAKAIGLKGAAITIISK